MKRSYCGDVAAPRGRDRNRRQLGTCLSLCCAFLLVFGALVPRSAQAEEAPLNGNLLQEELRRVIGEARDRVFPALVSIRVVTVMYSRGKEFKGQSVGSGTIIDPAGYVLTNQHVIQNGRKFVCTLSDKQELPAELVGEDPLTDLALLKLDLSELAEGTTLPVAEFGDSDQLEVGDYVMAMGSPFSLSRSVSLGIVSNTERVFAGGFGNDEIGEMELEQGQRTGLFTRWIQHDALINPGNSGGPLVNLDGQVVGVNELGGNAMGFAIPANLSRRVAEALKQDGEVIRSWIGLSFKPIQRTGLDEGVLINSLVVDGPAARAGIEAGDVLLAVDGEPVTVRFLEEVPLLLDQIASLEVGGQVAMRIQRGEEIFDRTVTTEKLEKDLGEQAAFHAWGLTAQEITPKMARDYRLTQDGGVLITGVRPGGPAQTADPPLAAGDVVRAIEGQQIDHLKALIESYKSLTEGDSDDEMLVEFDRRGKNHLTLIEPRNGDQADPPRELPKAWIGVATQPVLASLASELGLGEARGFRITRVYPNTEAEKAGLEVGDVIVGLDGEDLQPSGVQDTGLLSRRVRGLDIGAETQLSVLRQNENLDLPVVLERTRLTPEEARSHRDADFELAVRELTFFDRDENRWGEDIRGVLVEQVDGAGWAGLGGVQPFDLILRINDEPIRGLKSFRKAMKAIKDQQPERVMVVVLRGVKTHFQFLEPEWTPSES